MKRFKTIKSYTLYTLLVAFLFCGCSEPNVKEKSTEYILTDTGKRVKIIEVDGCEYIFYESGHRMAIAHKGNCTFCVERSEK